jgi:MYXO-CTERM domain-containing protein
MREHLMGRRLQRAARWLLAAGAVACASVAGADPITSPAFPGLCVEAFNQNGVLTNGAWLRLAPCNGSAVQDFRFDAGQSTLSTPRLSPTLCFDIFGPVRNGVAATVHPCKGSSTQRWGFPFNGRLRPIGADPEKCLTHFTRAGKPPTGWTIDTVTDPNCDFPPEGGGGYCAPVTEAFWEMALWDCDDRPEQEWRMPQQGTGGCQSRGCQVAAGAALAGSPFPEMLALAGLVLDAWRRRRRRAAGAPPA